MEELKIDKHEAEDIENVLTPRTVIDWNERNDKPILPREQMKDYILGFVNKNLNKTRKQKMYNNIKYGR